uniref:Uncharacterized protein n=1 Tax=Arundo donax TaxID=35708 RepID=A0A0A9HHK3_ARUDO
MCTLTSYHLPNVQLPGDKRSHNPVAVRHSLRNYNKHLSCIPTPNHKRATRAGTG